MLSVFLTKRVYWVLIVVHIVSCVQLINVGVTIYTYLQAKQHAFVYWAEMYNSEIFLQKEYGSIV
jgi:hypothetical protein